MVFVSPSEPGLFVVKRVIGVPGDRIHLRGGKVYLNGTLQNEPYAIHSLGDYHPYRDEFPAVPPTRDDQLAPDWQITMQDHIQGDDIVVPPNAYFGMGDNRDVSYDSRYWGFIPRENVVGRPMFIYWSFETPDDQYTKTDVGIASASSSTSSPTSSMKPAGRECCTWCADGKPKPLAKTIRRGSLIAVVLAVAALGAAAVHQRGPLQGAGHCVDEQRPRASRHRGCH